MKHHWTASQATGHRFLLALASIGVLFAEWFAFPSHGQDLLPDLMVRDRELLDHDHVTDGRRVLLRLAMAAANIGTGPLRVEGVFPVPPGGSQSVNQVVFRADGSSYTRPAGNFEYHPDHRHVHLEDWAIYRLRESPEGGGVGPVVAEGGKTSFCLLDSFIHHAGLDGAPAVPVYDSCGDAVQGISVGWSDYYHRMLYGQNIDVHGLPPGSYWLEVEVDPENHLLESDEGNNITRVPVVLGEPVFVEGPLEFAPPPETYHPAGKVDLLVGFRSGKRFHRGGNVFFPVPQILRLGGRDSGPVVFHSRVENEDHHPHAFVLSVTRVNPAPRQWSHFLTGTGSAGNITAAIRRGGYSFRLGAESAAAFRSVGALRRTRESGPRGERLILQVVEGSVMDRAHVVVSP